MGEMTGKVFCPSCQRAWDLTPDRWRCECGHPLLWRPKSVSPFELIRSEIWSLWRYRPFLALPNGAVPITLGEGMTPLIPCPDTDSVWLKLEFLNPTGSFKDRGACLLITAMKAWGVTEVIEDSSGNAGVALAAYARRANVKCRIFVPETTAPGKIAALKRFGAEIVFCPSRQNAAERALEAAQKGTVYASHTWHPLYLQGTKTVAYELTEQLLWTAKETFSLFIPVGNGDLLLGLSLGFQELFASGVLKALPRLYAIQARECAPIYADAKGISMPLGQTIAEGVAVPDPPRKAQILSALKETGGDVLVVSEAEILKGVEALAEMGLWVEPTGAIAFAAWRKYGNPSNTIILLTGAGWKRLRD